jgi:hypothetical protein
MMPYAKLAARDASIIAVALIVWWLVADLSAREGALGDFTGFVAGLLLGATGFVLHEWGHLLAALATRSVVEPAQSLRSSFIFSFDSRGNSLAQFLVMSVGGFIVTALVVWSFYVYLPDDLLASRVARGAALFLAFLGVSLELPLFLLAIHRRAIPAAVSVRVRRSEPLR